MWFADASIFKRKPWEPPSDGLEALLYKIDDYDISISNPAKDIQKNLRDVFYDIMDLSKGSEMGIDEIEDLMDHVDWQGWVAIKKQVLGYLGSLSALATLVKLIKMAGLGDYERDIVTLEIKKMFSRKVMNAEQPQNTRGAIQEYLNHHMQELVNKEQGK